MTSGTGGTAVLNADGTFTFTPNANFNGAASFTYTVSDGTATSNAATVTVNVAAVNDAPVAVADTLAATEDTRSPTRRRSCSATTPTSTADDADDRLGDAAARGGTAVLNADGTFTYTPNANFNGADSFTYTASDGTGDQQRRDGDDQGGGGRTTRRLAVADTPGGDGRHGGHLRGGTVLGNDTDVDSATTLTIASVTSGDAAARWC